MNIAIIPARNGSKRLPKKNIKLFYNKPIISYAIIAAKKTKLFDKIIVSTDSKQIKKIAEFYGAEVPYLRPKHLSNDKVHFNESIKHMIQWLEKKKFKPKNVCCIYPTTPLLEHKLLIKGYYKLKKIKILFFRLVYLEVHRREVFTLIRIKSCYLIKKVTKKDLKQ